MNVEDAAPAVSVIIRGTVPELNDAAIRSVLGQTLGAIEVLVTDGGTSIQDGRIHRFPADTAIARSRGRWVGWLDAGDLMHPRRLQDLVALAETDGCDIAADTMLVFRPGKAPLASLDEFVGSQRIRPADYARVAAHVRPLVCGALLRKTKQRSVESLLAAGAVFRVYPQITYFRGKACGTPKKGPRQVTVISRQRLQGRGNGSSAYLLSLCRAVREAGFSVHLVSPTPATFGRWPAIWLGREMAVFSSIAMRGAWRIGPFLVARDPRILLRAAAGLVKRSLNPTAAYAIGLPVSRADQMFVARYARGPADAVIADYAFLTDLIAYAAGATSLVLMHDLFSSRAAQFERAGRRDSTASISEAAEMAMLSLAGCVVAIQQQEAAAIKQRLPFMRVLTAPMAVEAVAAAQPGEGGLLFVGSAAAPNVDGLRWFLDDIWPILCGGTVLTVAGAVGRAVGAVPEGVIVAGRIEDLTQAYRAAAVVISPLRIGSGLKVKLIEALGHGKAIVATRVTVRGVEAATQDAVLLADDPAGFARAITLLLRDPALRTRHGEAALTAAREHFSPHACYGAVVAHILAAQSSNIDT